MIVMIVMVVNAHSCTCSLVFYPPFGMKYQVYLGGVYLILYGIDTPYAGVKRRAHVARDDAHPAAAPNGANGTRAICADDRSQARHPALPPQPSEGRNAIICATAAQTAERAARAMEAFMHRSFFTVK